MKDLENYNDPIIQRAAEVIFKLIREDKITNQEAFDLLVALNKKDDKETLTYPPSPLPYPYPPYEPCNPYIDPNPNPWNPYPVTYPIITWYYNPESNTNDSSRNDLHTYTTNTTC